MEIQQAHADLKSCRTAASNREMRGGEPSNNPSSTFNQTVGRQARLGKGLLIWSEHPHFQNNNQCVEVVKPVGTRGRRRDGVSMDLPWCVLQVSNCASFLSFPACAEVYNLCLDTKFIPTSVGNPGKVLLRSLSSPVAPVERRFS
jgi:hypothetical protein